MSDETPRVLLVDDLEANLIALEAQLERLDCTLVRASSGNDALRLLLKHEFAAMVLDVQMPDMDGFEVARIARQETSLRNMPIIFVTAMTETAENILRGYESGAVDLLFKPINPYVLRSKVQVFLELYRSRRDLAREIEAHEKTLGDLKSFNYSVAHDLAAPLRALAGFSRILIEDHAERLDAAARDCVERIDSAARHMQRLVDDLLRLSKVRMSTVTREPLDLTTIIESIVADLRKADPDRQVEVIAPKAIVGQGDARLVRILLDNLLRNAWKFTSKKERATIELGAQPRGAETVYFLRDDGPGFEPSGANRLFQPFQRLHSSQEFEGTGIGLAIARRVVEHHGGRIWAESSVGSGATFFFTLPFAARDGQK